ncbi:MAG: hypothetical protein ACYCX7_05055, partial [Solirubrobacteraceae bacterium]
MLGPAFLAAIAYVDPGNFATNRRAWDCGRRQPRDACGRGKDPPRHRPRQRQHDRSGALRARPLVGGAAALAFAVALLASGASSSSVG